MDINETQEARAIKPAARPFADPADQLTRAVMTRFLAYGLIDTETLLTEFKPLFTRIAEAIEDTMPDLDRMGIINAYRAMMPADTDEARYIRIGREVSDMMGGRDRSIDLLLTLLRKTADDIRRRDSGE
jgi:hypothetical protein